MEALRREHGMAGLGHDLLRVYSDGDITLYADPAELVPLFDAPPSHRHIGPVRWEPALMPPAWWQAVAGSAQRPIYVTLGSSGDAARLPKIVDGIARLGVPVVVAAAGAPTPAPLPPNVHVAAYLPGESVASRCSLVVCNGGSPTSHQALAQGVPVLALPANLDQVLNSAYLQDAGVGAWLRADIATPTAIERLARRMIDAPEPRRAAATMAGAIARIDPCDGLARAIADLGG
jgi:UDP:flavonoid glycosyltransferase YjiC (YdhE family)